MVLVGDSMMINYIIVGMKEEGSFMRCTSMAGIKDIMSEVIGEDD